jgi:hypothetical protein
LIHYNSSSVAQEYYFVVAPALNITEKGKDAEGKTLFTPIEKAPFGTVYYMEKAGIKVENKTYYKILYLSDEQCTLTDENAYKDKAYYIETENEFDLEDVNYVNKYKRVFPLKEAIALASHIKKAIMDYLEQQDEDYYFTQDANRIKSTILFADYNMDKVKDVAVILEDNGRNNCLLVFCYNKDRKQSYLAFTDANRGLAVIRPFKKETLIYMNSETLIKAPNIGILYESLQPDGYKYAILYEPETLQFRQFYQKPLSENSEDEFDEDYEDYGDDDEPTTGSVVVESVVE